MSSQPPETWTTRELPILRRILARIDSGDGFIELRTLASELPEIPPEQIRIGIEALEDAGYIDVTFMMGRPLAGHVDRVHERARRELGTWPTPEGLVAEIVVAFEHAAAQTDEPERRTKLQAVADALGGFARDVAVGVVSKHVGG